MKDMDIGRALSVKPALSARAEMALFENVEQILTARRALREAQSSGSRRRRERRDAWKEAARTQVSRLLEGLALHPDRPAFAAAFAALVIAVLTFGDWTPTQAFKQRSEDDSAFSDSQYEAQWLADRQALERAIVDAHLHTSGGL